MKKIFKWIVIVIVVLFIIGLFVGTDDTATTGEADTASVAEAQEPTIDTTAENIFNAYEKNEVAADQEYKGRNIRVTGTVASIDSGLGDGANVQLQTSNQFMSVTASGDDSFTSTAATLSKGQQVTMTCVGEGEVIGMPMLGDCVIQ